MSKLVTLRFALPTVVILTAIALAIVIVAVVTGTSAGTAWGAPG